MERIDKVISNQTGYSRKDVKDLIKKNRIRVNDFIVNEPDYKVDSNKDRILLDGKELTIQKYIYLVLNKPKGYVSATEDKNDLTVLDLVPEEYRHRNLFPAGRLDKDTTGLMIITDDGEFAHNILSPKKHVKKTYLVEIDIPLTEKMVEECKKGIILNDGVCQSAELKIIDSNQGLITLTEGRYHQIKRMFGCLKAKVINLKRISMGEFYLPEDLEEGNIRELTPEELQKIRTI